MKLILTKHVRIRMKDRNVSYEMIIDIISDYDNILPGDGDSERFINFNQREHLL